MDFVKELERNIAESIQRTKAAERRREEERRRRVWRSRTFSVLFVIGLLIYCTILVLGVAQVWGLCAEVLAGFGNYVRGR